MFWEVQRKMMQNEAREGGNMQMSATIHQNDAKMSKNIPFFAYKTLVLVKNRSNRRFNL